MRIFTENIYFCGILAQKNTFGSRKTLPKRRLYGKPLCRGYGKDYKPHRSNIMNILMMIFCEAY